jgi:hypothetical protein
MTVFMNVFIRGRCKTPMFILVVVGMSSKRFGGDFELRIEKGVSYPFIFLCSGNFSCSHWFGFPQITVGWL